MAKYSQKQGGKEVGQAATYAEPHTMDAKKVKGDLPYTAGAKVINEMNPSVAGLSKGNYKETKTTGIKMRGAGAATKGTMCRGPMG
jgi:hypothetical protein